MPLNTITHMAKNTAKELLEKVKSDYNKISKEFDQTRKHSWEEFETYLKHLPEEGKILDLACGNGRFYKFLKEKQSNLSYLGVDNSEKLISHAKSNIKEANFKLGDMLDIPCSDNEFSAIACIAALHHIPTPELRKKAIQEMKRVTMKGGIIIISVWNLFQDRYKKYINKARIKSLLSLGKYHSRDTLIPWAKSGINRYYYAFKQAELRKLIEEEGLEILEEIKGNNFVFICKKS